MTGEQQVRVPAGGVTLDGDLGLPAELRGVVCFAHGSGSSRHSPRNRFVAETLREAGLVTLLMDLLTPEEDAIDVRTRELRFDIDLLAARVVDAVDWLGAQPSTAELSVGLFGASTGAAGALVAAARRPDAVAAVVSRGGRPDLAGEALEQVRAPTLLIVGGADTTVLELNRQARQRLSGPAQLEVVEAAGHLFEEPGALEQVATLARDWFQRQLTPAG
ncbi:MAG TPA: dienelactone hydrolase family protein [Egibacteraceae bacterium]|nr:dienelactone hydrolase family protein [Egibacteraceae bacterium]